MSEIVPDRDIDQGQAAVGSWDCCKQGIGQADVDYNIDADMNHIDVAYNQGSCIHGDAFHDADKSEAFWIFFSNLFNLLNKNGN